MSASGNPPIRTKTSRREFPQQSTGLIGGGLAAGLALSRSVHAAGSDVIEFDMESPVKPQADGTYAIAVPGMSDFGA